MQSEPHSPSLLFGITGTGVLHLPGDNPDVDTRFAMVRDAGVFDYYDRTPPTGELDAYRRAIDRDKGSATVPFCRNDATDILDASECFHDYLTHLST